jgi:glycosyltransferase involved in cell wall biosynthesis
MQKISVVIITYNEEKNIGRCLESVKDIADDIVVVDSFSSDKTKEICIQHNARFIENKFEGHIQQKNFAITQAKFPFILSLDADEALSQELTKSILMVKENGNADGYYFNRLTNYCGKWIKHCGWYPDKKLRLWISKKGKWGGVNPHDKFEMEPNSKIEFLKGDLFHYSFYTINQHMDTINKFSEIAAKEKFQNGKNSNIILTFFSPIWKFIKTYFILGGIRDGFFGYVISVNSAHSTFLKHVKLRELNRRKDI